MRRCLLAFLVAVTLVAVQQVNTAHPMAQAPRSAPPAQPTVPPGAVGHCDIRTTERVVAVGDVHGAHDGFRAILRAAALIDTRDRWVGGRAILVQTGDVLDRGADSRKTLDLLRRLERDARGNGGQVIPLLGNHEFMRVVGDWRYVSPGEYEAFRNADSIEIRDNARERSAALAAERARTEKRRFDAEQFRKDFFEDIPLGYIEMKVAFSAGSDYGDWIRSRQAVARINGVLFIHGGISPTVAALGCAGINQAVTSELKSLPVAPENVPSLLASQETGPLWYRGLAEEKEPELGSELTATLQKLGARAVVIGHTVALGRITPRFGGRVLQIDTGMLGGKSYPGGGPSALEIHGDTITAIYPNRREPLGTLPTS